MSAETSRGDSSTCGACWRDRCGRKTPYSTPADGIYLCSASTPPGAGVHGMCGYHAAQSVLRRARRTGG